MDSSSLSKALCATFCENITVRPVPVGYAVSTAFSDASGDRLTFYLRETPDGYVIEDDGDYLSLLVAKDIPITEGVRGSLLDGILQESGAYWDRETYEIRTPEFGKSEVGQKAVGFLSSLIRVRDLELLTRETVRSTFREDFLRELQARAGQQVEVDEGASVVPDFSEFPADIVIRAREAPNSVPAAVYLVNSNDKLNEALLAWQEVLIQDRSDFKVFGVIEEPEMKAISRRRFQRAQNRRLAMPIFRGDEDSAISMIMKDMRVPATTH